MVYIQALIHLMHKKYKFIQNKHLIISSFFDNLEATLESVDDVNNFYELKLNYHIPLYWRGTKQMFKDNWQEI